MNTFKVRKLLATTVLAAVLCVGGAARADGADAELATAENAYAALDYPSALASADAVLARGNLSHDVLTRATRVAALSHAALGHADVAKQQFILLLEYDPDFKVDSKLGPRFFEPFAEARGYWQAQGRKPSMDVQVAIAYGEPGDIRVSTSDPMNLVKKISVGQRWAPKREYTTSDGDASGRVEVPANPKGSTRLEYYVRALDAKGNAIFEAGTPNAPKTTTVTEPAAAGQEKKKSIFASPIFYIVGGAVLAAAATGGYFALRPTEYTAPTTGRAVLGVTCGSARCD